ncbi:MAG: hypothetical protein ACKOX3_03780 [Bacteroidota bacterium]
MLVFLIPLSALLLDMNFKKWRQDEKVIAYDVHAYYGYLPAKFIFDDIKVEKSDYKYGENQYWFWLKKYDNGGKAFDKTYGMALLYSPFFAVAHQVAKIFDYPLTGFSEPYQFFLLLSAIFYFFLGLLYLRKLLLHYNFSDKEISITLLIIALGTNLFCYASSCAPQPEVYLFALSAIFAYATAKWHTHQKLKSFIMASASLSLLTLIYLPLLVFAIYFLLYDVKKVADVGMKKMPVYALFIFTFLFVSIWLPQLKYWKLTLGSYLGASENYEHFYFLKPMLWKGLFGFQKGWFIYTPLMLLFLPGAYFMRKRVPELKWSFLFLVIIHVYLTLCWWNWWYGGSFGQSMMIPLYPILAIAIAVVVSRIVNKGLFENAIYASVFIFFVALNVFQLFQFEKGSLHGDAMNSQIYFKQFGKLEKVPDFEKLLTYPNYEDAKKGNR